MWIVQLGTLSSLNSYLLSPRLKKLSLFLVAEPITFPSGGGKSFIMGSDDVLLSVLGLGDLADLTVANDADYSYDVSTHLFENSYIKLSNYTYCRESE